MKTTFIYIWLFAFALAINAQKPELVVPVGHSGAVQSVAFSFDGRFALSGSDDRTLKLWDITSGVDFKTFKGHKNIVTGVAFSRVGNVAASSSYDKTVKLWDLFTGEEIRTFKGHKSKVKCVAFSPDGKYLISGSRDLSIIVWNVQSGKKVKTLTGHSDWINSVTFSPDGQYILSASEDKTIKLWELGSGEEVKTFKGHSDKVNTVAFLPGGKQFVSASADKKILTWNIESGDILNTYLLKKGKLNTIAVSPDGNYLAVGIDNKTIKIIELKNGNELDTLEGHTSAITSLYFSPDGKKVISGSYDKTLMLWDISNGEQLLKLGGHSEKIRAVVYAPDGSFVIAASDDHTMTLWSLVASKPYLTFIGHKNYINSIVLSSDGKKILTGSNDGTLQLWDTRTGESIQTYDEHTDWVNSVDLDSAGNFGISGSDDHTVKLWDIGSGQLERTITGNLSPVKSVKFSPDGTQVLAGTEDHGIKLWDLASGKLVRQYSEEGIGVNSVDFSPDGNLVIAGLNDRTVKIWNRSTGKLLHDFKGHSKKVTSVCFSPDGLYVLSASNDQHMKLWNLKTNREVGSFEGHSDRVLSAAFSPKGNYVVSGSSDNTLKFWNMRTYDEIATLMLFDREDWVVYTPTYLFDTEPSTMKLMSFIVGPEVLDLDQLKKYWEPGLLSMLTRISRDTVKDVSIFDEVKLFPQLDLDISKDVLTVKLNVRDGGLGPTSLFINGTEVIQDIRDEEQTTFTFKLSKFKTHMFPEESNVIGVITSNLQGIYSRMHIIAYEYKATGKEIKLAERTNLFAIIIGTSDYKGEKLDLKYADKDAVDFADAIRQSAGELFGSEYVHVELLATDQDIDNIPTKKRILQAFLDAASASRASDILLVYLSGHGISKGQFYYLTKDVSGEDAYVKEILENYAISADELTEWIKKVPAKKQVMIIDACASGQIVEDLQKKSKSISSDQMIAFDRMKHRTGMFIITGSAADMVSYEASQFGQGLLTYSLLSGIGMRDNDALKKGKFIDVSTLFQYARDKVPIYAKYVGGVQEPGLFPAGASFDIGIVNDNVHINVAPLKPMFVRSNFMDRDEDVDAMDIAALLNSELDLISMKGKSASIIYVDAKPFPSSYRITGSYTTDDKYINISGKLWQMSESMVRTKLGEFTIQVSKENNEQIIRSIMKKVIVIMGK